VRRLIIARLTLSRETAPVAQSQQCAGRWQLLID
jgi:hypothetical protein